MFAIFGRCLKSRRKKKTWNFNFVMVMHGYVGDCDRDLIVIVMYLKDANKEDSTRVADRPPVDHHKQRFQPGEVFGHLEIRWSPFKWGSHQPWSAATTGAGASLKVSILLGRRQSAPACQRQGSDGLSNNDMAWEANRPLDHLCICHLNGYGNEYGFRDNSPNTWQVIFWWCNNLKLTSCASARYSARVWLTASSTSSFVSNFSSSPMTSSSQTTFGMLFFRS